MDTETRIFEAVVSLIAGWGDPDLAMADAPNIACHLEADLPSADGLDEAYESLPWETQVSLVRDAIDVVGDAWRECAQAHADAMLEYC